MADILSATTFLDMSSSEAASPRLGLPSQPARERTADKGPRLTVDLSAYRVRAVAPTYLGMSKIVHIDDVARDDEGALADGVRTLLESSALEFRVVITPEGRKGFRLEHAFWRTLSAIAERQGTKRSHLMSGIVREAAAEGLNTASALRSYVAQQLESELETARKQAEMAASIALLQQAPVPSFAVDRKKKLIRVNAEFNHFLRILFAEMSETSRNALQINLERPVTELFDELGRSGESVDSMMNVVLGSRFRRIRTRLVAVPPHAPTALVGFVTP
ncbi:MAG: ribbon-helix-helix domain-containing protein [Alphaproteobacteria bacterium]|nr:ribbon-helix-helix domain-containing protein [Alphaproteobacteria bacterium]